jgi:hypothetical protein
VESSLGLFDGIGSGIEGRSEGFGIYEKLRFEGSY